MWRAFFYAVGVSLILVGVQFLVVDHFVVANGTRVPGFVAKFLNKRSQPANPSLVRGGSQQPFNGQNASDFVRGQSFGQQSFGQQSFSQGQPNRVASNFNSGVGGNGSRFGPSRFADSQFSNSRLPPNANYYGGVPSSNINNLSRQSVSGAAGSNGGYNNGSAFSLAGYGVNGGQGAVSQSRGGSPTILGGGGSRLFEPKDWMPWCMLAIGTLVVLYTNSTGRGFTRDS